MSKRSRILVGLAALVLLILAPVSLAVQGAPADSRLRWHTYAGSPTDDVAEGTAVDPAGNAYLTGWSDATWGSPILPYSGGRDAFVAKLSSTGELEWNTFVARYHPAIGYQAGAIAVDGSDAVYVVVTSPNAEGRPSALLLKLDPITGLQWQRFMTTHGDQVGTSVAIDAAGNVYVGGWGGWLWDTPPVEPFPDRNGTFVAKLNSSGVEAWHALLGPWLGADDFTDCRTLAVDASGNVYVTGSAKVDASYDDFATIAYSSAGVPLWTNRYNGPGNNWDEARALAVASSGNVFVTGVSVVLWMKRKMALSRPAEMSCARQEVLREILVYTSNPRAFDDVFTWEQTVVGSEQMHIKLAIDQTTNVMQNMCGCPLGAGYAISKAV